jgi:hypothetical protein
MLRVYVLCGGYLELGRASMLPDGTSSRRWTVPVHSYLIAYPQGHVLFDAGVHCQALSDPVACLGKNGFFLAGLERRIYGNVSARCRDPWRKSTLERQQGALVQPHSKAQRGETHRRCAHVANETTCHVVGLVESE